MNTNIFDKKVAVITPLDVMPKEKLLLEILKDETLKSLDVFVLYGIIKNVIRKTTKSGEQAKLIGDFETYNCLTGEILKSNTCFMVKSVELFLTGILSIQHRPIEGFTFAITAMVIPNEKNRKDYLVDFIMMEPLIAYDPLMYIREVGLKFVKFSPMEQALAGSFIGDDGDLNASGDADGVHYDGVKVDDDLKFSESQSEDSCEAQDVSEKLNEFVPFENNGVVAEVGKVIKQEKKKAKK